MAWLPHKKIEWETPISRIVLKQSKSQTEKLELCLDSLDKPDFNMTRRRLYFYFVSKNSIATQVQSKNQFWSRIKTCLKQNYLTAITLNYCCFNFPKNEVQFEIFRAKSSFYSTMKKLDIHNHILPENWPDLKEVSIFQLCLEQETRLVIQ